MTCIDEWTQKLEGLGLRPVPSHLTIFIRAICAAPPVVDGPELLLRLYAWPKALLKLTRLHDISDEQFELLRGLYLAGGDNVNFKQELGKLPRKGEIPPKLSNSLGDATDDIKKINGRAVTRREAHFDLEVKDAFDVSELAIDPEELASLKQQFLSTGMTKEVLKDLLTKALAKKLDASGGLVGPPSQ